MSEQKLIKSTIPLTERENKNVVWDKSFGQPENFQNYFSAIDSIPEILSEEVNVEHIANHGRAIGIPLMFPNHPDLKEIDIKSVGSTYTKYNNSRVHESEVFQRYPEGYSGLMDIKDAIHDHKIQKVLKAAGVRTHESIGVIPVKQIIHGGKPREIKLGASGRYYFDTEYTSDPRGAMYDEPRETYKKVNKYKFYFKYGYRPGQQIRAWGTQYRVQDVYVEKKDSSSYHSNSLMAMDTRSENDKETPREKLEYAINLVKEELKRNDDPDYNEGNFGPVEYLYWFAKTFAKNLALMHRAGYAHGCLHFGNVTLDCRLTDFDTVTRISRFSKAQHFAFKKKDEYTRLRREVLKDFSVERWSRLNSSAKDPFPSILKAVKEAFKEDSEVAKLEKDKFNQIMLETYNKYNPGVLEKF